LASLLQRRRSTEANQTLHNVWPLPGLVDYIYIFGDCCSVMEFCQVQNSLCVLASFALSYWQRYCTAVEQWVRATLCGIEHRATTTLGIGPHSSLCMKCIRNCWTDLHQIHTETCFVHRLDKFEGQGHRLRSPGTKTAFSALSVACMKFMFGKTSLASSLLFYLN